MMMKVLIGKIVILSFGILLIQSCKTTNKAESYSPQAKAHDQLVQHSVDAVLWYNTSAENSYIYKQTYKFAKLKLVERMENFNGDKPPAIVLDLDETVINNSAYFHGLIANNQTYSPETWNEYVQSKSATALPGSIDFINFCQEMGVQVIFISNRNMKNLNYTFENLTNIGIESVSMEYYLLKEDESDKTERRDRASREHEILLYLGDNLRDFSENYAHRLERFGKVSVEQNFEEDSERFILFPNPVYGEWQKPITLGAESSEDKLTLKLKALK